LLGIPLGEQTTPIDDVMRHRLFVLVGVRTQMMSGALIGYVTSILAGAPLVTAVHNSFDRHSALMRLGHRVVAVSHAERDLLIKRGYQPDRVDVV
jgi:hypothetical protein